MCRNIPTLFNFEPPATQLQIRDARQQSGRKRLGLTVPSQANTAASQQAGPAGSTPARADDEVANMLKKHGIE